MEWEDFLTNESKQEYFIKLSEQLEIAYETKTIYPLKKDLFNAFAVTPLDQVKVVILGQDPYHQFNQAHGLCFSVNPGIPFPPSLNNIFKELIADMGCGLPKSGCLVNWAMQGVFLLNTYLSVEANQPLSHSKIGWEIFTDHVLRVLNEQDQAIVFILWGSKAQQKAAFLNNPKHLVLSAPHPSPLSAHRGFFGSRPFSKSNQFLIQNGLTPIAWCL